MFPFSRPRSGSKLRNVYLRTTRMDKDLSAKIVKSDLLLEERRLDAAEGSSERGTAMATRRQEKPKQQYKNGARPKPGTHMIKSATNVIRWATYHTSAKIKREIKRGETKGRRRDWRITGERGDRKKSRGPRDSYRLWLCRRSVT